MPATGSRSALPSTTEKQVAGAIPLLFARHGRTAWNRDGRYQGRADPPLTNEGLADADSLAARLRGEPVAAVITSPLRRASATAEHVARALGLAPPATDPRLAEIAFGTWEGRTQADIRASAPDDLRRWKRTPGTMRFPGGETLDEALARLRDLLADIARNGAPAQQAGRPGALLLLTHAGIIRLARLEAHKLPADRFRDLVIEPGTLHRYAFSHGKLVPAPGG